jgi:hypothetical protein
MDLVGKGKSLGLIQTDWALEFNAEMKLSQFNLMAANSW